MTDFFETPGDTGVTQSETVELITARTIDDTLAFSDAIVVSASRTIDDTLTFSDYIGPFSIRGITDTGVTPSDTPVRLKLAFRTISDTGSTVADQYVLRARRFVSDTGVAVTDSTGAYVEPAPDAMFTYLCSRNWNYLENNNKWVTNAYGRFTYTTIAD